MAGLNVLKIINEPTAAALAFQLKRNDDLETKYDIKSITKTLSNFHIVEI
jgi:molecular chaperone DnaK (HSP70)